MQLHFVSVFTPLIHKRIMQNKSSFACWKCDKSWIECHFTLPYYPCTRFSWHSIFNGGGGERAQPKMSWKCKFFFFNSKYRTCKCATSKNWDNDSCTQTCFRANICDINSKHRKFGKAKLVTTEHWGHIVTKILKFQTTSEAMEVKFQLDRSNSIDFLSEKRFLSLWKYWNHIRHFCN